MKMSGNIKQKLLCFLNLNELNGVQDNLTG
jgi:hypothetical protein